MARFEIVTATPVTLASPAAEAMTDTSFRISLDDERLLAGLDYAATAFGFIKRQYFTETHRALSIPASFEADEPVAFISFMGLQFEGIFVSHSKVVIGHIIGAGAVRALCLTFDNVTLLPCFDSIPPDHLLHVPVMAVASMQSYDS